MTYHPIEPAELAFDDKGTPYAPAYGDVYHTSAGGLRQARHVFLDGNDLPRRWQDRRSFTIVETGFGLGLNFLAAWQAWRDDPQRSSGKGRLHFVAVEKHPLNAADLAQVHERVLADAPSLRPLAAELRAQWPLPLPGLHRLHFGQLTLTLAFGDAAALLPQLALRADAFFLDGFAPAKNPDIWSDDVVAALRRLAAPDARLATWSVAGELMRRLASADFLLEKRPGLAPKFGMLAGRLAGAAPSAPTLPDRVAVIGAGIAGTAIAERLAARGIEVTLIDAAADVASGASGNPLGIVRPLPSLDDNRLSRLLRAGYLHAARHLQALQDEGLPLRWRRCGVLHLARDAAHEAGQRRAVAEQAPPPEFARFVERDEAARIAGWPVDIGGWWFAGGAWIDPASLCRANLLRGGRHITARFATTVERLERNGELWQVIDGVGRVVAEASHVVLAAGAHVQRLAPQRLLPVWPGRGTVSLLPESATPPLEIITCRQGYVTPALDGIRCAGATMARAEVESGPSPRVEEHRENLSRLEQILPGYGSALDAATLAGRTSFRPMSPDRLPLAGALPPSADAPADGLFVLSGFGARGLVWCTLTAELLASRICGEPLPVEADLAAACDPRRFLARPPRRL